ncbi:MAG: hypothetical protein JXR76_22020 [Deltaproteobacteria bacterium]|nr:hypothetical protein [Deltaproteobacteria bacterium]
MQWSRLKKQVEAMFCDSLKGQVELRATRYRGTHDEEGKGWITVDKEEIYDFCTMKWMRDYYGISNELRAINRCTDHWNPEQRDGYYAAYDEADKIMNEKGNYSLNGYYRSLENYLSLSIDDALGSEDILTRAIAMIDRRFGKRRIRAHEPRKTEHSLVKYMLELRCAADGIRRPDVIGNIDSKSGKR